MSLLLRTLGPVTAPEPGLIACLQWLDEREDRLWSTGLTIEVVRGLASLRSIDRPDAPVAEATQAELAYNEGMWLRIGLNGRCVAAATMQLLPLGSLTLSKYLAAFGMSKSDIRWEAPAIADEIAGLTCYLGGGWKHPDIRRAPCWRSLATDLHMIAAVASYALWSVDFHWWTILDAIADRVAPKFPGIATVAGLRSRYPDGSHRAAHLGYLDRAWLLNRVGSELPNLR